MSVVTRRLFIVCFSLVMAGELVSCKRFNQSKESASKFTQEEREGKALVVWEGKKKLSRPDLLALIKRARVVKEGTQYNLDFKSKGSVRDWTFTQVVKAKLKVKGTKVVGVLSQGGSYQFYFIGKAGKPVMAEYVLLSKESSVVGELGQSIAIELALEKRQTENVDGTAYAKKMPTRLKLSAEVTPEWI